MRRALVTGGATRVDRSISLALAEAGYDVAVHYASSGEEAAELLDELRGHGGRTVTVCADPKSVFYLEKRHGQTGFGWVLIYGPGGRNSENGRVGLIEIVRLRAVRVVDDRLIVEWTTSEDWQQDWSESERVLNPGASYRSSAPRSSAAARSP